MSGKIFTHHGHVSHLIKEIVDVGTVQRASEILTDMQTDESLAHNWYWTADGLFYRTEGGRPIAYITRNPGNLFLHRFDKVFGTISRAEIYEPTPEEVDIVLGSDGVLRVDMTELCLKPVNNRTVTFIIDLRKIDNLSKSQREVAEKVYGSGDTSTFNRNMELIAEYCREDPRTAITLENPDNFANRPSVFFPAGMEDVYDLRGQFIGNGRYVNSQNHNIRAAFR